MDLMKGKKGVIFGVSNTHGIAYGIAKQLHEAGAEFTNLDKSVANQLLYLNIMLEADNEMLATKFTSK